MKAVKAFFVASLTLTMTSVLANRASSADLTPAQAMAGDVCEKCHGPNGTSSSPLFPRIAGQKRDYIDAQLKAFRDHSRGDPQARAFMWGIAGPLSDKQIAMMADYYAALPPTPGTHSANTADLAAGKALYEEGDSKRDIPACVTCHGPNGEGIESFPRLGGQHFAYLVRQLHAFHGILRESEIMDENAKALDENDINVIADYLSSQ